LGSSGSRVSQSKMLNEDDARLAIVVELSDFEIEALNGEAPETSPLPLVSLKSESRGIVQHQQVQKSVDTRKLVDETVSIENVQHGVRGAKTLWNWGFARVVEQAARLTEEIAKSEAIAEVHRSASETQQAFVEGANEASRIAEAKLAKVQTSFVQLHEDLQPRMQIAEAKLAEVSIQLSDHLSDLPTVQATAQRAAVFAGDLQCRLVQAHEELQPAVHAAAATAQERAAIFAEEAHEKTRTSFRALGAAAHSAIWLQSR